MKTRILKTQTKVYEVVQNDDNTLSIYTAPDTLFKDAGLLINNLGGIDAVLEKTISIDISFEEHLAEKENILKTAASRRAEKFQQLWRDAATPGKTPQELYEIFLKLYKYDPANRKNLIDIFFYGNTPLNTKLTKELGRYSVMPYQKEYIVVKAGVKTYSNARKFTKTDTVKDLLFRS